MSNIVPVEKSPRLILRLFSEETAPEEPSNGDTLSSRSRLSQFFERWWVPIVGRKRAKNTISEYRTSVQKWVQVTGDPPMEIIDEFTMLGFVEGLLQSTFRRGIVGSNWPLRQNTVAKHARQLSTILNSAGPQKSRGRPTKELLAKVPFMPAVELEEILKPPLPLEVIRKMVVRCIDWIVPSYHR